MPQDNPTRRRDKTPTGLSVPQRKRDAVMSDFEKVAGPLRGQNRDRKPKA